jgi:hypothetical protein
MVPDLTAKIGFGAFAKLALSTLWDVCWNHMITFEIISIILKIYFCIKIA